MNAFAQDTIRLQQQAHWLDADTDTPISLYLKMVGKNDGILLESAEVDGRWGRYSLLACDMLLLAACVDGKINLKIKDERLEPLKRFNGKDYLAGMRELLASLEILPPEVSLPPITRALYGYLGFGMAAIFNPHLQKVMPLSGVQCQLALPGTVMVFDHLYNRLCHLSLGEPRDVVSQGLIAAPGAVGIGEVSSTPDAEGYKEYVRIIREMLRQGEAIQVVPSVRFCADFHGDPFLLYRRLRRFNASPYMFYMQFPELALFGSSPEVMARCTHGKLELSPIAGTRRRGKDQAEDQLLAEELLQDPKDRAEHVMLVDLGRNDLGRIAKPGSVQLKEYMQIQRFSHVMHLTSEVTAELKHADATGRPLDALDVLAATFPAGTVSGAPKYRAMEIIWRLEGRDRGAYAGCIGWIGLDKGTVNLDMGITIRSMWLKDGKLCWQAGGGIVHDSDPELEWNEVCNKSAIMRLALKLEDESNVPANR